MGKHAAGCAFVSTASRGPVEKRLYIVVFEGLLNATRKCAAPGQLPALERLYDYCTAAEPLAPLAMTTRVEPRTFPPRPQAPSSESARCTSSLIMPCTTATQ